MTPITIGGYSLAQLAKGVASAIATLVTIVASVLAVPGVIPLSWLPYITAVVAALGTVAVVLKANAPSVPTTSPSPAVGSAAAVTQPPVTPAP